MIKFIPAKIIALVMLFMLPFAACKKSGTDGGDDDQGPVRLNAGTFGFVPFEIVQVPLQNVNIDKQELNTTINGQPLKLAIISNYVHFIVPDLPEGQYTVKFKAEKDFEFSISVVKPTTPITTAEEYRKTVVNSFNTALDGLDVKSKSDINGEDKAALTADKIRFKALFDEYEKAYANLNAEDKLAFARTMAANYQWILNYVHTSYSFTKATLKIQSLGQKTFSDDIFDYENEQNIAINKWMGSSNSLKANIIKLAAMILIAPATASVPVIGQLGTGIAIGYLLVQVSIALDNNTADHNSLLDVSFAPYDELSVDDEALKNYDNAEERVITVQSRFRNLISTDLNGSELIGNLKAFTTELQDFKSRIKDLLSKMPERFKPSVVLRSVKASATAVKRQVSGAYLSITNITNAQVKVAFSKLTNGAFKIVPTVTGTTDQQVSFDVTYSNSNFSNKVLKKTITTTVKYAVDSTAYYRQLAVGNWTAQNMESGVVYNLTVKAGGQLDYIVDNKTYKATWEIIKVGKKYYFWEYGFWHDAYNQFRVYNKGFADEGLKTPLTGFMHYNDLGGGKGPGAAIRYVKK